MSIDGPGREQLRIVAAKLKEAGNEGKGLKRALQKNITKAAEPLAAKIASVEHLKPYMPDPYAAVLAADLGVKVANRFAGGNPAVQVRAQAREHKRKVARLDAGTINHPVYARGARRDWTWSNNQTGGMKAGFFSHACRDATPQIRSKVLQALTETAGKITAHG
jgi:hypothetical protein